MVHYSTTANTVWYTWTTATDSTTYGDTWTTWCDDTSATYSTTSTATVVWKVWTSASTAAHYGTWYSEKTAPAPKPLTEEEKAALAEQRAREAEERAAAAEKARKESEAATKRAEKLLRQLLTPEQRKEYDATKSFHVQGADGERYKVRDAWSGHVERIGNDGAALERFCLHPSEQVPIPDNQAIAKLMLETNPKEFRRIANVTRLRQEPVTA